MSIKNTSNEKKIMAAHFLNFSACAVELSKYWGEHFNGMDFADDYPFTESFDELILSIIEWQRTSIKTLETKFFIYCPECGGKGVQEKTLRRGDVEIDAPVVCGFCDGGAYEIDATDYDPHEDRRIGNELAGREFLWYNFICTIKAITDDYIYYTSRNRSGHEFGNGSITIDQLPKIMSQLNDMDNAGKSAIETFDQLHTK